MDCSEAPRSRTPSTTIARTSSSNKTVRRYIIGRFGPSPERECAAKMAARKAFKATTMSTNTVCHGLASNPCGSFSDFGKSSGFIIFD